MQYGGVRKTYQIAGKWIEKTTKTEVLVCSACGGKYLKTRTVQETCVRCITRPKGK
ncbi:MAG: hypothetical protein QT00_C0003G0021 [archaeon GW2011_AR5]|nr:MAG: hypothetical protein QT00_C0003G0021 [archaeon GW2011_AR5]